MTEIIEIKIGYDGIVIANSKAGADIDLTARRSVLALAKQVPVDGKLVANPYKTWNEIDPGAARRRRSRCSARRRPPAPATPSSSW